MTMRRTRLVEGRTRVRPSTASTTTGRPTAVRRPGRRPAGQSWYRIENRATGAGPSYAEVYLYDEIGMWGVTAGMFVSELGAVDTDEIDLHVNSPGGDVWDGIAIYNALVNHRASVTVYVDGIAASAASVVAMAGDRVVMARGSQMMIHDAWMLTVGNEDDHIRSAADLARESLNIAGIYSDRAGGTANQWRKAMKAETWYTADEAVAAGLADEVASKPERRDGAGLDDDPVVANRWDLAESHFKYAGREASPAPAVGAGAPAANGAATGAGGAVATAPTGQAAPPVVDDPAGGAPTPDEGEPDTELELPGDLGEQIRNALTQAADDTPEWDDSMADVFRAVITDRAENAPATPAVTPAAPAPRTAIPIDEIATALKEALQ